MFLLSLPLPLAFSSFRVFYLYLFKPPPNSVCFKSRLSFLLFRFYITNFPPLYSHSLYSLVLLVTLTILISAFQITVCLSAFLYVCLFFRIIFLSLVFLHFFCFLSVHLVSDVFAALTLNLKIFDSISTSKH